MFSNFFSEIGAVYDTMSKNMVELEAEMTIWRMRVACRTNKGTRVKTHACIHREICNV
jgi:hypothetical protein